MNRYEDLVIRKLPARLGDAVVRQAALHGFPDEIRLRTGKLLTVTIHGKNVGCGVRCTEEDIDQTVRTLCGNSLYSHSHTIKEGYIDAGDGIRAGIAGQAVLENGQISALRCINTLSIRIPRRIPGAADEIYERIRENHFQINVLIYAKPGMGKTTVLKELAIRLSTGTEAQRVAVVDTRCELGAALEDAWMVDVLRGYPRSTGIETAVRTLSPQYIICDEILTDGDVEALITAIGSGVRLIASIHAESYTALMERVIMKRIKQYGVFDTYVGLVPSDSREKRYHFVFSEEME